MKEKLVRTFAKRLKIKALELQRQVEEYYHTHAEEYSRLIPGFDENGPSFAEFLGVIANHLSAKKLDRKKLKSDVVGIYRIVSDDAILEKSELGRELYNFNDELKQLVRMLEEVEEHV